MLRSFLKGIPKAYLKATPYRISSVNNLRHFATSGNSDVDAQFNESLAQIKRLKVDPGNDAKLKLYSLYKQSTEGKIIKIAWSNN